MISKRNKQILSFFLRDKNKKNWLQIIKELTALFILNKELPINYISHLLYRKNVTAYKDYLSLKENRRLLQWSNSNAQDQISLVENKLLFEGLLNQKNIPTPKIHFHNTKNSFVYEGDEYEIKTKNDFIAFLKTVFLEKKIDQLFCKPIDGIRGQNIFIVKKNTYTKIPDKLAQMIFSGRFIFQELISQHEALKKINSSSINTLRIVTYKDNQNNIEILSGFIRFGRKGAIIDNAHVGGIVVPFDKETGKLHSEGLQLIDNGGGIFFKHPDTGIVFENIQIPLYVQVREKVAQAAGAFDFPLLGWDVALTPTGPMIIEANHDFHLLLSDLTEQGLKRNPSIKRLLNEPL